MTRARAAVTAALVVSALAIGWVGSGPAGLKTGRSMTVATMRKTIGSIVISESQLPGGDRVETRPSSRAMFVLAGGTAVSVDESSIVDVDANGTLTLIQGAVFVDAGPRSQDPGVHVRTPLGIVQHRGTQFEVRLEADTVRVRVREGRVRFASGSEEWHAHFGQAMLLRRGRMPQMSQVAFDDAAWDWTADLVPPFQVDGAPLRDVLDWVCRRQGWLWRFEPHSLDASAGAIVMHGSIEGLTAEAALDAALRPNGLTYQRTGQLVVVGRR
jgi:ferric-dicitrate binding protein FerR (iron transport regulator)